MIGPSVLHSVSYAGLWGQAFLPVEEFVDEVAALGYEGVMLMAKRPHMSVLAYGPKERARLRRRIDKDQFQVVCMPGCTNITADREHGDIPHREIQIQHVSDLARTPHDLGGTWSGSSPVARSRGRATPLSGSWSSRPCANPPDAPQSTTC